MASINFINECKNRANGNRLGKIIVDNYEITNSDNLQNFSIDSGCYVDGNIIGSVYVKCLKGQFISVPDSIELIDKTVYPQVGVKYADSTTEYIDMGKYTIERPKDEKTANYCQIIAYDDLINKIDSKYICGINYSNEITLKNLYIDVCEQLKLVPVTTTFLNSSIPITANPFTNGETNRVVLQTISKIASSFVDIDPSTNKIDLKWLSQNEEADYIFELNDYATLEGGTIKYGPINCLIIKNSQIDDENVTIKDDESIALYGENSIVISEDYILYNAELRQQAINSIWNRVHGMSYVDCKLTSYYGKPFLKLGDKIKIYTSENEYFDTYVLTHNFTYDGTYTSIISSPAMTKTEIATKQELSLKEKLSNTEIKVNKQDQKIESLTTQSNDLYDNLNKNYYTIEQTNLMIQTAESGVTNTFSEAGGNNVFRNTGLWFIETRKRQEESVENVLANKQYSYCEQNYDGPIYSGVTLDYAFKTYNELQPSFMLNPNNLVQIYPDGNYKYTYTNLISRYDLILYELDENKKFIADPYEPDVARSLELVYGTDTNLILDENTRYIVIIATKNDSGVSATIESMQTQLDSIELIETRMVEISEEAYEFWEGNVEKSTNEQAVLGRSMLLQAGKLKQEQEVPNGNYSVSFYYKKLIELATASVTINENTYNLDSLETKQFYTGETDSDGAYITLPVEVKTQHLIIEFNTNVNNSVEVYDLMANKGSVKLAYSQNQNEVTTETVNLSKGITIKSSNIDVIFKANADGIRLYTLNNEVKTRFTDKGLVTKEAVVEDEAEIVKVLIQDIDDQTWFTRM